MEETISKQQDKNELINVIKRLNKSLITFLAIFVIFSCFFIVSWVHINYKKNKMILISEEKQRLRDLIAEKKQLRNEINEVFLTTRSIRSGTKRMCGKNYTKEAELIEQQKNYDTVLKTVKIYYPTKLLFGIDVGSTVFSFVKLADNNIDICVDGDYDLELRKLQWKTNVLVEDSIIKDQSELKKLIEIYS